MNWGRSEGSWKQRADNIKRHWGKLIDQQLDLWTGTRDRSKQPADGQARLQQQERHRAGSASEPKPGRSA
jgi:uncharacterized protein YjbJ (UPF0337 family)